MDGVKDRLNGSVQRKLSLALSVVIAAVALVAGALSFAAAYDEAQELQDDMLRQAARLVDGRRLGAAPPARDEHFQDHDDAARLIVQPLGQPNPGGLHVDEGGALPVPVHLADGLHTLTLQGEGFRLLIRTLATGERFVVAQEADFRDAMARDSAVRTVLPFVVLVPVLLLLVATLVRQLFRPISALARELDRRTEQDLQPIDLRPAPSEVRPFVHAINRLLGRVAQDQERQRRFVADAAHELRSPLTALSLQAERLAEAEMSGPARERLSLLRQGIERGRSLLDQLLTLAKVQSASESILSPISIQGIYRRVLEDLMPLAEAKHIDIGVEGTQDVRVEVSELDMIALVKNLVDNAIRYTPEGGRVDLSVSGARGHTMLRIQDTGPGIALSERKRVFDAFYRTLGSGQAGSGLGLAIVQAIANRIGAEIRFDFSDAQRQTGLSVTVLIPKEDPTPAILP